MDVEADEVLASETDVLAEAEAEVPTELLLGLPFSAMLDNQAATLGFKLVVEAERMCMCPTSWSLCNATQAYSVPGRVKVEAKLGGPSTG